MNISAFRSIWVLLFILVGLGYGIGQGISQPTQKNGNLVVLVTWGDIDNTPATDVYIEAHGFKYSSEQSVVLKMSRAGRYEASLPPGVYDVFVSESTSIPRCRRVRVSPGFTGTWILKLEIDDVYTEK